MVEQYEVQSFVDFILIVYIVMYFIMRGAEVGIYQLIESKYQEEEI